MKNEQSIALRAGLFVILLLTATGIAIFVLGTERGYFKNVFTVYTSFFNVMGLQPGAPVRLSGVTVGKVNKVIVPHDPSETRLTVQMQIESNYQDHIRTDSVATIKSLSYVTGDYYIAISMGSSTNAMVQDGESIRGIDPADYSGAFESGTHLLDSLSGILKKFDDAKLFETLGNSVASLNTIIEEIRTGTGMLHSMIYGPEGNVLISNISKSSEHLRKVTRDIAEGDNLLHSLLYDKEYKEFIKKIAVLSEEVDKMTDQIKSGEGLLHAILYDKEKGKILDDLAQVTENLKRVSGQIAHGEGSIGAIINDPALYDNLMQLLGGANRSFLLRTMIRHSMKKAAPASGEVK